MIFRSASDQLSSETLRACSIGPFNVGSTGLAASTRAAPSLSSVSRISFKVRPTPSGRSSRARSPAISWMGLASAATSRENSSRTLPTLRSTMVAEKRGKTIG